MRRRPAPPSTAQGKPTEAVAGHIAHAAWLLVGLALFAAAEWPPSCAPQGWTDIAGAYRCSARLAQQHGWVEATLLTWMWATPILASMTLLRLVRR